MTVELFNTFDVCPKYSYADFSYTLLSGRQCFRHNYNPNFSIDDKLFIVFFKSVNFM